MNCYDTDTLIDLSKVLGDDPRAALDHVLGCERCMNDLRVSAAVRGELNTSDPMRPGFTDQVIQALPRSGTRSNRAWVLVEPTLAGITVLMAAAAASTAAPLAMNLSTLLISGAVGLGGSVVLRRSPFGREVDLG